MRSAPAICPPVVSNEITSLYGFCGSTPFCAVPNSLYTLPRGMWGGLSLADSVVAGSDQIGSSVGTNVRKFVLPDTRLPIQLGTVPVEVVEICETPTATNTSSRASALHTTTALCFIEVVPPEASGVEGRSFRRRGLDFTAPRLV